MFIVVEHKVTNPEAFFGSAEKVTDTPEGLNALQFFPSTGKDKAVCLWEAPSIEAVQAHLEPILAEACENTYYAVDSEVAMGLPVPA